MKHFPPPAIRAVPPKDFAHRLNPDLSRPVLNRTVALPDAHEFVRLLRIPAAAWKIHLKRREFVMQVREVMTADVHWIPPDTTVQEAARRMREKNVGALPIGENDRLIGMVTDRDIVTRILPERGDVSSTTVKEAMSEKLLYCFEDQTLEDVAGNMGEHHVRRLPVLNREKRLVGIISLDDIAKGGAREAAGKALGEGVQTGT